MYETILSPINYGGLTLKNRIIFAPTSMGLPREQWLERMRTISAGGCAMIIIGDVPVSKHGFGPSYYKKGPGTLSGTGPDRPRRGLLSMRTAASV